MHAYSPLRAIWSVTALAAVLAGCSGRTESVTPILVARTAQSAPNTTGTLVYVCGAAASTCVWFPLKSQTIAGTIELQDPVSMAVDSVGNVYIPQQAAQQVEIYPKGSTTLLGTLTDRGEYPSDVAVALDGTVYVANLKNTSNGHGSVSVYRGGVLKRVINDPNFTFVNSVAVDEHHLLIACYSGNGNTGCDEFPGGRGTGIKVVSGGRHLLASSSTRTRTSS